MAVDEKKSVTLFLDEELRIFAVGCSLGSVSDAATS